MKQKRDKGKIPTAGNTAPLGALADAFRLAGIAPSTPVPTVAPPSDNASPSQPVTAPLQLKRLRLRTERNQRGGKTVTRIEGLPQDAELLQRLLKQIKSGLGCGGTIEEGTLVLQGDIVPRVRAWLEQNA